MRKDWENLSNSACLWNETGVVSLETFPKQKFPLASCTQVADGRIAYWFLLLSEWIKSGLITDWEWRKMNCHLGTFVGDKLEEKLVWDGEKETVPVYTAFIWQTGGNPHRGSSDWLELHREDVARLKFQLILWGWRCSWESIGRWKVKVSYMFLYTVFCKSFQGWDYSNEHMKESVSRNIT